MGHFLIIKVFFKNSPLGEKDYNNNSSAVNSKLSITKNLCLTNKDTFVLAQLRQQHPFLTYQATGSLRNDQQSDSITPSRAIARFFVIGGGGGRGIIASAEGTRLVGGSEGILPQKILKFGGSETLFSALVKRDV